MSFRRHWPLLTALLLACAARLVAGAYWQRAGAGGFAFGDSESYWVLARTIAHGQPYRFGPDAVFRAPGYPLVLAPLFVAAGPHDPPLWAARVLSALLGAAAVGGVWWLARLLFDRVTANLAALVVALYPGAVALGGVILSEALFCPLVVLQLALWSKATGAEPTPAWRQLPCLLIAFAAGLVGGVATLTRPSWLLFTPLAIVVSLGWSRQRRRTAAQGLLGLAGLIVALLPWWVRNAVVTGHFVPTTLQVGASLYDGLNPAASGASDMRTLTAAVAAADREWEAAGQPDSREYYRDGYLRRAALQWALEHPGRAIQLAIIKLVRFWNIWPNEESLSSWAARLIVVFTFVPLAILGIIGARFALLRGWPWALCWLPAVYLTLLHLVFVSSLRYREPAMLPLLILAAWTLLRSRWGRKLATVLGENMEIAPRLERW